MRQEVELESFDCLRRIWCGSLLDSKIFDVIHEYRWGKNELKFLLTLY
jgi:hypothetical protein